MTTAGGAGAEAPPPAGPTGSVVLDIGGSVGAIVVEAEASDLGREIEARAEGHDATPLHAAVLARSTPGGVVHAAVIPGLVAGRYSLWWDDDTRCGAATVVAGQVATTGVSMPSS